MLDGHTEALEWASIVRAHKLTLEHARVETVKDHVLYHMELELKTPLPMDAQKHGAYLCLTWPYGGLWKIDRVHDCNTKLSCYSTRKTDLKQRQLESHARDVAALSYLVESEGGIVKKSRSSPPPTIMEEESKADISFMAPAHGDGDEHGISTLFEWKMMHGCWGKDAHHWFIHDIDNPKKFESASPGLRQLYARLFVGFAPLQAQLEVHSVTHINNLAQSYAADVTWIVTMPAITTRKDNAVLAEFMYIMEIDPEQFEFSNVSKRQEKRDLSSSITPAGYVNFQDRTNTATSNHPSDREHVQAIYHLQYSRRVTASFTKEMALHTFPFDQQKLNFEFTTGISGMPHGALQLIPAPVEPGSFSVENFQLGNVFDVVYHDKIFVSRIHGSGPRKTITFEMVLERKSMYYMTNVALIAAVITYLCFFVSYAPGDKEGNPMDTGTRLQNATAMVLTAVMFKNQVAALVPEISYFTMLDSYVFICFMVTSGVTIENALYPLIERWTGETWYELNLLGYSMALFTLGNFWWLAYLHRWLSRRRRAAQVLMQIDAYIKELAECDIPASEYINVLINYLDANKCQNWCRPGVLLISNGDIHIQAPDDIPDDSYIAHCVVRGMRRRAAARKLNNSSLAEENKERAKKAKASFERIHQEMGRAAKISAAVTQPNPPATHPASSTKTIPAAKTTAAAYQAGGARGLSRLASYVPILGDAPPNSTVSSDYGYTHELVEPTLNVFSESLHRSTK